MAATEDLDDLYENAPCGYLSIDPAGRIVKVNATFAKSLGFIAVQLYGRQLSELLSMAACGFFNTYLMPLLRTQGFFPDAELELVTGAGGCLPVLINAVERRDAAGEHLFTRMTIFDVNDRCRYQRELLGARAAAEAARRDLEQISATAQANLQIERETAALREEFIAVLGHDLRNPLAAIASGAVLLKKMPLTERGAMIAGLIHDSAARMAGLIDNVLDFARGRLGGGLALDIIAGAAIEPTLNQVIAELRTSAPERQIEARFKLDHPVSLDQARIAQLFSNLLGNALTHGTPNKPVRVTATSDGRHFALSVTNASKPIPPEVQEKLFLPFFRGTVRPSLQGLGLGLYIASEIARAHNGRIDVESGEEETSFTFRMPLGDQTATGSDAGQETEK